MRRSTLPIDVDDTNDELLEDLPASIDGLLQRLLAPGETIELAMASDIRADGSFGDTWLVGTNQRLLAIDPADTSSEPLALDLRDVLSIELRDFEGSGALHARTSEHGVTLARFSRTFMPKFSQTPRHLEQLVRRQQPERAAEDRIARGGADMQAGARRRCDRCNRVIPRRFGLCPACLETRKLLVRLLSYAKPYWALGTLSLVLMIVATTIGLSPPLLMGSLFDDVLAPTAAGSDLRPLLDEYDGYTRLAILVFALLAIFVSNNVMGAVRRYVLAWLGQHVTFDLRNEVYRHLNTLSLSFYNERETGRVMASITQDVSRLQDFISDGLQEVIRDVLTIVIICAILFWQDASLAALVLLPTPLLVFTTLHFGGRLQRTYRSLWRRWAGISALLADTIPGVRVVKAFSQESREVGKFERRSEELLGGELRAARLQSLFSPIMAFITRIGTLVIWLVGGSRVLDGELSLGAFVVFTGYMWQFYGPVEGLCRLNHRFQRAATSAERVFETLDSQPDVRDVPDAATMPRVVGRVEFDNVTFAYDDTTPVLEHIELVVEPGEMIGLAGHSGAGKSTLINLICRFYDVTDGAIRIDGRDIRDVELKSLRDQIGIVLQDPFLFNGTVGDNIAYGKPGASLDEIVAAARAAHAHDFLMNLPQGYDTVVGERGTRLSGGERQRVSIARAILRDPRILILDEATSSVDTETEVKIQEALERLIRGRTTFAIAHRLSTLRHANRLLILDKGQIAEVGTHDELLEVDGVYARLCRMQSELTQRKVW